jgi:hypothetical protein
VLFVGSHEDDLGPGSRFLDLPSGGDAVETREIEVHEDDVRPHLHRQENRIVSPAGLGDDPHPRPQLPLDDLAEALVVVDDHHRQRHARPLISPTGVLGS